MPSTTSPVSEPSNPIIAINLNAGTANSPPKIFMVLASVRDSLRIPDSVTFEMAGLLLIIYQIKMYAVIFEFKPWVECVLQSMRHEISPFTWMFGEMISVYEPG